MGDTCSCSSRDKTYHHNNGYGLPPALRLQTPPSPPPPAPSAVASAHLMGVVPQRAGGRLSCVFLVLLPMCGVLAMSGLWVYYCKQNWDNVQLQNIHYQQQLMPLGQLLLDFNTERELTVMYTTVRSEVGEGEEATKESSPREVVRQELEYARKVTDDSLGKLLRWPGTAEDGQLFRSPHLFAAVLDNHRTQVKSGNYFWEELQFYTNIIDVIFGWLNRELGNLHQTDIWKWLLAYSYLLGGVNYLGAEQALCSAFYSIICFSKRETFYYANFSFSGEAVFRLYRQAYPGYREGIWRITPHQNFFPELNTCRDEIFADMNYPGMGVDPLLCDFARKNETRFHDLDVLTVDEHERVLAAVETMLQRDSHKAVFDLMVSALVFISVFSYIVVIHLCRCVCIKCHQTRKTRKWRERKEAELMAEEDKMMQDHLALQQTNTMIKYDDFNCKGPNSIHVKVATV